LSTIKIEAPKISYDGPAAIRDSRELMSVLQQNLRIGSKVLDLGCGPKDQKPPVEYLGFDYLGIDYSSSAADLLGDAHSIPFRENSFDCVLSYAVLEHLHSPCIAIREIERILKPCGIYVGTVSQGEPFHDSYFHLTPWGLVSLISSTRSLRIEQLWDSMDTLASLSRIGRYPRAIKLLIGLVDKVHRLCPFLAPKKMNWPKSEKQLDRLYRTGSIAFVIRKNGETHE
jgi:ubiquinone/menaquinone biosynthesis C-methylase UbiE